MFTPNYNYNRPILDPMGLYNNQGQTIQTQTIQTIQPLQTQVVCYFVSSAKDLDNVQAMPNTVYIGLNNTTNEIYKRRMNNNGLIELETYKLGDNGPTIDAQFKVLEGRVTDLESKVGGKNERFTKQPDTKRNDG